MEANIRIPQITSYSLLAGMEVEEIKEMKIVLIGINGYGNNYLQTLLNVKPEDNIHISGVVDPAWSKCVCLKDLERRNIPVYNSLETFYSDHKADLAVISSPIHLHVQQSLTALENGSHVLCEKPLCATIQEARLLQKKVDETGKLVNIGYQWSFSSSIKSLKQDIINGIFGKPLILKTLVHWPRPQNAYYKRNNWAGAIKNNVEDWILDSPVNNATAHFLHNMFYILGSEANKSTTPIDITAELYRANDIENFDTAALRCHTTSNAEILFYSTHAVSANIGPVFDFRFENAVIYGDRNFTARFNDGTIKKYDAPPEEIEDKLWQTIDAVRSGNPEAVCGVEAALAQTICVNGAQESMPEITEFPAELIKAVKFSDDQIITVDKLDSAFIQCFDLGILPSEHGNISWAKPGKCIDLKNYCHYPSFS